jgi:N-acetylglucosamine-6-phosphate deacetylase
VVPSRWQTTRREKGERIPGLIECSLASNDLTAEVIADGHHLPPQLLEIARRCLGGAHQRLCGVSDASIGTGMPEGHRYGRPDRLVEIRNGVANLVGQGRFAGSTTALNGMGRTLLSLGWPITEVVTMLSTVPACVLSLSASKGILRPGYDADIAIFDQKFNCKGAMIGGAWAKTLEGLPVSAA